MGAWTSKIVGHERVAIDSINVNPLNFRRHGDEQTAAIEAAIAEVGFIRSVTVNLNSGNLIDGHLRLARARAAGETEIDVEFVDLTSEEEAKALATLDPICELATVDPVAFDKLIREFETGSEALQQMIADLADEAGLYRDETEATADPPAPAENIIATTEDDGPEEPPAEPITQPGDLWILGEHRLLCGDSTIAADVARLMGDERAGLMNTDPPYGIAYDTQACHANGGDINQAIANDDLCDEPLQGFLEEAFRVAVDGALAINAGWYIWHAQLTQGYFSAAAAAANVVLHRQIIWVKPHFSLGRGQYHWQHEPCFMGWVKGQAPPDYGRGDGERNQTTVWELAGVPRDERKEMNHPTPKPIGLFAIPIVKHLLPGEICYEPFAGSGPQFIAAEQLGRRCFGLELSPAYCDAIVRRWEKLTGRQATRAV